jgi:hypothetical protein
MRQRKLTLKAERLAELTVNELGNIVGASWVGIPPDVQVRSAVCTAACHTLGCTQGCTYTDVACSAVGCGPVTVVTCAC